MGKFFEQNKIFIAIIISALIIGGFIYLSNKESASPPPAGEEEMIEAPTSPSTIDEEGFPGKEQEEQAEQKKELTQEEIKKISKSVVAIKCNYDMNNNGSIYDDEDVVYGSGTYIYKNWFKGESTSKFFNYLDGYILTNGHVSQLSEKEDFSHCWANFGHQPEIEGKDFGRIGGKDLGIFFQDRDRHFWDEDLDIALLKKKTFWQGEEISRGFIEDDDYLQSNLLKNYPTCLGDKIVGSKVYVFGYPGSAFEHTPGMFNFLVGNLIISEGIISGKNLNGDYYTDAKMDSGVSGGLAVSKMNGEICIIGIPTWIGEGQYENLGLIEPFQKVIDAFKTIELP